MIGMRYNMTIFIALLLACAPIPYTDESGVSGGADYLAAFDEWVCSQAVECGFDSVDDCLSSEQTQWNMVYPEEIYCVDAEAAYDCIEWMLENERDGCSEVQDGCDPFEMYIQCEQE